MSLATAPTPPAAPPVARREGRAMGSPLRLQVAERPPAALVDAAWGEVVDEFEATEQALSRFRPTSEIHRLRLAGGHAAAPSRRLVAALTAADRARRLTDGRFDPRVLADLERLGSVPLPVVGSVPDGRPDPAARIFTRDARLDVRSRSITIRLPVDFGGIGKGLALRWAARRAAGVLGERPFLLDAGGDILASGSPAADGWRIGIEDPRTPAPEAGTAREAGSAEPADGPIVVVELPRHGGAIATSSVRRARWVAPDGRPAHHLIDPRTGDPGGDGLLAVTVAGRDPAWAEVWSKSLFLEGRSDIAALARRRGLAAWWTAVDGEVQMTPAARLRTIWVAGES